jgi:two-component system, cell cycle response regulator
MVARFLFLHQSQAFGAAVCAALSEHFAAEVFEAHGGAEARRVIIEHRPGLALCDLGENEVRRRDFLHAHGCWTRLASAPIIALLPEASLVHRVELMEEGVADFVTKPFLEMELVSRVRLHWRAKMLDDELRAASQKLESLAVLDELTGLYNRRHLGNILATECRRYVRYRTPVCLVLIEVEGLQRVMHDFGRTRHDDVLRRISDLVASSVRATDWVARHGDRELALVLPHTDLAQAALVVERLRKEVGALKHAIAGGVHCYPARFGLVCCDADALGPVSLMERAAAALDAAKKHGSNRVEVRSPR